MAAKSSFNASHEDDEISDDDDKNGGAVWTQTTAFELYARDKQQNVKVMFREIDERGIRCGGRPERVSSVRVRRLLLNFFVFFEQREREQRNKL